MTEDVIADPIVIETSVTVLFRGLAWVARWLKLIQRFITLPWLEMNLMSIRWIMSLVMKKMLMKMTKHQEATTKKKVMRLLLAHVVKAMTHLCHKNVDEDDEAASTNNKEKSNEALVDIGGEDNDSFVPQSIVLVSHIDRTLYYIEEELRALKLKYINLREFPNHKDISGIGSTVCDSALVVVIKKGQLFESLEGMTS
jgi:hypothetical protein